MTRRSPLTAPLVHLALWTLALDLGCGGAATSTPHTSARRTSAQRASAPRTLERLEGRAAYYSDRLVGRPTASGEPYRAEALTAAHRTLPLGTRVLVTNLRNHRSVEVRINDRGPFGARDRIIDVSRRAAERLDMIGAGVIPVEVRVLSRPAGHP